MVRKRVTPRRTGRGGPAIAARRDMRGRRSGSSGDSQSARRASSKVRNFQTGISPLLDPKLRLEIGGIGAVHRPQGVLFHPVQYQLILTDLSLTGDHGTEGLDLIRYAREHYPESRIILMTAHGSPEIEREARRCGVDAILNKPVPLPHLAQVVGGLLEAAP